MSSVVSMTHLLASGGIEVQIQVNPPWYDACQESVRQQYSEMVIKIKNSHKDVKPVATAFQCLQKLPMLPQLGESSKAPAQYNAVCVPRCRLAHA